MQDYKVSARKYRPPRFEELVGQDHITTTLRNAIAKGQLAQAYLFCGPRGVGKTSCARILAKTINCSFRDSHQEACGECPSCQSFVQGRSLAIHELDAASNNSVDDIRSLVDQVRYPPQGSDYKVYIIDEVHMLSTAAFNALLKTLEEPPTYAKFILATTEKHKILPTILSRCQIFDFKRIRLQDIAERLALVCRSEEIVYENDALLTIASRSDGALRDALTMLDQLAGFSGGNLTNSLVCDQLGVLDKALFADCTSTIFAGDPTQTLQALDSMVARGYDSILWVLGMASHFRNLLMAKTPGTTELIDSGQEYRQQLIIQSQGTSTDMLLAGLHLLNQVELQYRQSRQPRLLVETAVVKICYLAQRGHKNSNHQPIQGPKLSTESETHPLQGITTRLPVADFKTPAQVKIQAKIPSEPNHNSLQESCEQKSSIQELKGFSDKILIPEAEGGGNLQKEHSLEPTSSNTQNIGTATTVDFLQTLRGHLVKTQGNIKQIPKESSHRWSPPPQSSCQNLHKLWQHLVQECRDHNLGGLEGILSRNMPLEENQDHPSGSNSKVSKEPALLSVILYSDTEKSLFDGEKQGILDFLVKFGAFETRPQWAIQQRENNTQREKFLTEPERFNRLNTENDDFKDLSARLKLFLS